MYSALQGYGIDGTKTVVGDVPTGKCCAVYGIGVD